MASGSRAPPIPWRESEVFESSGVAVRGMEGSEYLAYKILSSTVAHEYGVLSVSESKSWYLGFFVGHSPQNPASEKNRRLA